MRLVVFYACVCVAKPESQRDRLDTHVAKHAEVLDGCRIQRRPGDPPRVPVIGLMVTKNDDAIIAEWLKYNMPALSALVLLDSSDGSGTADAVSKYRKRCPAPPIDYMHERDLLTPITVMSDAGMRQPVLARIRALYGRNQWVYLCHSDEFFYHEPEFIAALVQRHDPTCNRLPFYQLHVFPHTSEWPQYNKQKAEEQDGSQRLVQQRFQHINTHCRRDWNGPETEWALFRDDEMTEYIPEMAGCLPQNGSRDCRSVVAAQLHYKVVSPDPNLYTRSGIHRSHWRKNHSHHHESTGQINGVGIGMGAISSELSFFQERFRNCQRVFRFEGCLALEGLSWEPAPVAPESLRLARAWPLSVGPGTCNETELAVATARRSATRSRLWGWVFGRE